MSTMDNRMRDQQEALKDFFADLPAQRAKEDDLMRRLGKLTDEAEERNGGPRSALRERGHR